MRITNSMMTNSMLLYMNKNKADLSRLEQQMATGKVIQKPSENPIVAIRAIKFRTDVREIEQYQANIKDAISWMNVTEQALQNSNDLIDRIRDLCVQGRTDTLGAEDREKITNEIEQLKMQLEQEGNVNYAGRFVFTGFKTDKSLVFNEDNNATYEITQNLTKNQIDTKTIVEGNNTTDVYRIRLAYKDLTQVTGTIPTTVPPDLNVAAMSSTDPNAYVPTAGQVNFLQDTGELIFHENDISNVADNFSFTYEKQGFEKNDIRPEHYFKTTHKVDPVDINTWETYDPSNDKITYQVSYNQDIEINTLGKDVLTPDIIRDLEELIEASRNIPSDGSVTQTLLEDELGEQFDAMIGKIDEHKKAFSSALSEVGSRINRLELTSNRLSEDYTNFTELMSENEDVDIAEVVIKMKSYEMVYNASLMASAKIIQPSLLDFIR